MSNATYHVLVVDDNEMNRDMLSRRLKRLGYDVLIAENGKKALEMIKENPFDLVLLDIMMPGVSGYDVLEQVKADPNTRQIPVIMISAVDDLDSVVRCIEMGAEDYLFKPFNPVLLKARVQASLSRQQRKTSDQALPYLEELESSISQILGGGGLNDSQSEQLTKLHARVNSMIATLTDTTN